MPHRRVWHPDKSLALQEESEESLGRASTSHDNSPTQAGYPAPKRRMARIVRRKKPTVEIRTNSAFPTFSDTNAVMEGSDGGYSTVEKNSHGSFDLLQRRGDGEEKEAVTEFCGWKVDEHKHKEMSLFGIRGSFKATLQSRELPSSRLLSGTRTSTSRRKREQLYCFRHMQSAEEYMKHYNAFCSFSCASSAAVEETSGKSNVEQRRVSEHTSDQKSSRQGTAVPTPVTHTSCSRIAPQKPEPPSTNRSAPNPLTELASRIGVQDSIRQPQLLKTRTPPSITTKRNEQKDDLVLQPQGQQSDTNKKHHDESSTQRPLTTHSSRGNPPSSWRERLPLIVPPPRSKPSTSVISVSKYLHVNHGSTEEEKNREESKERNQEESQEKLLAGGSSSTLSSPPCNNHTLPPGEIPPPCTRLERTTWPCFPTATPDPLFENVGKEEILRRKADSLGLLSHKWAKSFLERGFMNGSLPHHLYHNLSRPTSREQSRPASRDNRGTENPLTTRRERKEKMERLESVYGGRQQRKKSARKHHSDGSCSIKDNLSSSETTSTPSRPPTRRDMKHSTALHKLTHRVREAHQSSRPATRADRHGRTPVSGHRPLHKWKTGGEGTGGRVTTTTPTQLLEGVLGVSHQQC